MPIKRILLPVSGEDQIEPLAETAFRMGQTHAAQVQGVFVQSAMLNVSLAAGATSPEKARQIIEQAQETQEKTARQAQASFAASAARHKNVDSSFVSREGDVNDIFVRYARLSDLIMAGSAGTFNSPYWRTVRNAALFRSGRPVLVVPVGSAGGGDLPDVAVIAWKESLEASRAIAAAQPFLATAREVHLVAVGEDEETARSLQDVEAYLLLHYAEIRTAVLDKTRNVSEALLGKAEAVGGMLVMGAYSHWRWQEQVFGGVTETMLRKATVPVLMAH